MLLYRMTNTSHQYLTQVLKGVSRQPKDVRLAASCKSHIHIKEAMDLPQPSLFDKRSTGCWSISIQYETVQKEKERKKSGNIFRLEADQDSPDRPTRQCQALFKSEEPRTCQLAANPPSLVVPLQRMTRHDMRDQGLPVATSHVDLRNGWVQKMGMCTTETVDLVTVSIVGHIHIAPGPVDVDQNRLRLREPQKRSNKN